jgi:hypothetical protein
MRVREGGGNDKEADGAKGGTSCQCHVANDYGVLSILSNPQSIDGDGPSIRFPLPHDLRCGFPPSLFLHRQGMCGSY